MGSHIAVVDALKALEVFAAREIARYPVKMGVPASPPKKLKQHTCMELRTKTTIPANVGAISWAIIVKSHTQIAEME